ncbi:MAG: Sapep family Mn(2+)-dependent dipeptidase [Oscillospiraceae bacterium]|nr:Sapep family Mn(2+)-dependent dipeptidase [Oscillospiraceae bacterium]
MDIKSFLQQNKDNIINDLSTLIGVRSVKSQPEDGAPFGREIRNTQLLAIEMCKREGFETTDAEGMIALADYGPMEKHIGVFSHLDVVPEGEGWDSPAYELTEREGFLVGRGVGDNKGPFIMSLYALKYIKEQNIPLNYGVRLIIGVDEESGMTDAEYYTENFVQPGFTFTPDSDFPVCHGEKGIYQTDFVSRQLGESAVICLEGGLAFNVVPDYAQCLVKAEFLERLREVALGNDRISLTETVDGIKVEATGVTAHAGTPFSGVNAINQLLNFLIKTEILSDDELKIARFITSIAGDVYGKAIGIDCDDKIFTPLTIIVGVASKAEGRYRANINVRYPTAMTQQALQQKMAALAEVNDLSLENTRSMPPFYLDPNLPAIVTLRGIYESLTGKDGTPYVMSGGTYARKLNNAVAFGPDFKDNKYPDWVGAAHMKNEALNIDDMMLAIEIYTEVLIRLQEVEI